MDAELKAKIRQWKAGMEAGNEFVLEQKRNQTPEQRMKGLMAFLGSHAYIGIDREKPDRRTHRMPYGEIQERLRDRHTERICRD